MTNVKIPHTFENMEIPDGYEQVCLDYYDKALSKTMIILNRFMDELGEKYGLVIPKRSGFTKYQRESDGSRYWMSE